MADGPIEEKVVCGSGLIHTFCAFRSDQEFNDDGFFTYSSTEQKRVEDLVKDEYISFVNGFMDDVDDGLPYSPTLYRNLHIQYLCNSLKELGKSYSNLCSSRTWLCYWGVHSLRILEANIDSQLLSNIVRFIKTCEWKDGGYGVVIPILQLNFFEGGPGQYPHLATTYAAVMALVSIGTDEALKSINRKTLYNFLLSVKKENGSFEVHRGGEIDVRGSYCALSVASITNILDDILVENTASWVISCQTYEGGFGSSRCCEAHGGYTFCGVASLLLLDKAVLIHTSSLFKWLSQKQMKYEGGFQGRSNKLVDGCYSFWQGAVFPMLEFAMNKSSILDGSFDAKALQEFILISCQDSRGGLRDKPDKPRDLYHTCYTLSGLSIAQQYTRNDIVGGVQNLVAEISPVYNVCEKYEKQAREYFSRLQTL
ncbi:unnamed protein product [Dracunculus medinensis]|uniref:Protein farnesyltransferase subunit beta n=1 Tax=Dracunculus medinensis TaxID=318479 RepID=A0A0N4UPK4_DRAME|nr:unnamed protein product [Dracunculus medinensis]